MRRCVLNLALGFWQVCAVVAAEPKLPPLPPLPASPVTTFRALLAMSPEERNQALNDRSEAQQALLRARVAEYEALPAEQREERLRATDLYWHLQQLLRRAPAERQTLLASAPADLRSVLSERLALWDRLPEADREALLQHERAIRYFARLKLSTRPPLPAAGLSQAPALSLRLQADLAPLQNMGPTELKRIHQQWQQFFESPPARVERALQSMGEQERREMAEVLERFKRLPPAQRQVCIDSFARLASLPPAERAAFLKSAEKWESLTAQERATWRHLVTKLPPLPPTSVEVRPWLPNVAGKQNPPTNLPEGAF